MRSSSCSVSLGAERDIVKEVGDTAALEANTFVIVMRYYTLLYAAEALFCATTLLCLALVWTPLFAYSSVLYYFAERDETR
jgi:hypothetical protein